MVIKLSGCTYKITHIIAANVPRLPHLVPTYFFFKFININVNIRNER